MFLHGHIKNMLAQKLLECNKKKGIAKKILQSQTEFVVVDLSILYAPIARSQLYWF